MSRSRFIVAVSLLCVCCLVLVVAIAAAVVRKRPVQRRPRGDDLAKSIAIATAQECLTQRMQCPSTAQYDGTKMQWTSDRECCVIGNVTARNAMNAPIRHPYFVRMRHAGDRPSARWDVEELVIGDTVIPIVKDELPPPGWRMPID